MIGGTDIMRLGVDPGQTGAFALLSHENELVKVWDMPITARTHGKGNEVNGYLVADIVEEAQSIANEGSCVLVACLERVNAMPGQGVTSMFHFGESYGLVKGVLQGNIVPILHIKPTSWKKKAGLSGKPKEASLGKAIDTWPESRDYFKRKKDIGRADAALIALMARTLEVQQAA